MMMQGGHAQNPSALPKPVPCKFKPAYLQYNTQALCHKYPAQQWNEQLLSDEYGKNRYNSANGQTSCVAHEYLGGIGVIPQKTD